MHDKKQHLTELTQRINEIRHVLFEIATHYDGKPPHHIENQRFYLAWELEVKEKERAELVATLTNLQHATKSA